jgi:hypothetical protein
VSLATRLGDVELIPIRATRLKPGWKVQRFGRPAVVKAVRTRSAKEGGLTVVTFDDSPTLQCVAEYEVLVEVRRREVAVGGSR